jgi:hypothetical protein
MSFRNVRGGMRHVLQLLVQGEDELRKRKTLSWVSMGVHWWDEERWRQARDCLCITRRRRSHHTIGLIRCVHTLVCLEHDVPQSPVWQITLWLIRRQRGVLAYLSIDT